jgi:hypothetical protein
MRITKVGLCMVMAVAGAVFAAPAAGAATDSTAPSVPQNLQSAPAFAGDSTIRWDASTDDSSGIFYYWVIVDGQRHAKPAATTYNLRTLVDLCRITPGTHTVTVQAVDRSFNRSAQSNAIAVDVR